MGRKRRRVIRTVRRVLPKVFTCPRCGMVALRVSDLEGDLAKIACGSCGKGEVAEVQGREMSDVYTTFMKDGTVVIRREGREAIDVYNRFVDIIMKGGGG